MPTSSSVRDLHRRSHNGALGDFGAPAHLASEGTLSTTGSIDIIGKLYAPRAELVTVEPALIYGSMFLRRSALGAELHLHYDESAASPVSCPALLAQ